MDPPDSDITGDKNSENGPAEKQEENASSPIPVENASAFVEVKTGETNKQKRKIASHPPTSTMVVESIKRLKLRNGVPGEVICEDIEETYKIDMKRIKPLVSKFLKQGVEKGMLVQVSGDGIKGRFKVNKVENSKKVKQDLPDKKGKVGAEVKSDKPSERKKKLATHPPTAELITEAIKRLKLRKGASAEAICKNIEGIYEIDMKKTKPLVKRYLKQGVEKGTLLKVSGDGIDEKFKVNKLENPKKVKQNLPDMKRKIDPSKKVAVTKKKVK